MRLRRDDGSTVIEGRRPGRGLERSGIDGSIPIEC